MNKTFKIRTIALAVTAALVLPSAALAASAQEGYGGPNNVVTPIPPAPAAAPTPTPAPTPAPKPAPKPAPTGGTAPAATPVSAPAPETAGVNVVSDTAAADTPEDSGSLPFTGADLGVLAIAGMMMLALGFGLRRLTHRTSQL